MSILLTSITTFVNGIRSSVVSREPDVDEADVYSDTTVCRIYF